MTDYPIIFSSPMIRALLDGRKMQTRRLAFAWRDVKETRAILDRAVINRWDATFSRRQGCIKLLMPTPWQKVQRGDRLWVRETWHPCQVNANHDPRFGWPSGILAYQASWTAGEPMCKWRPSIHMPRWASRITLGVTEVRRQRLQEISHDDAKAEGIEWRGCWGIWDGERMVCGGSPFDDPRDAFRCLWVNLHGNGAWDANPEIVPLTFTVALRNIDAQEAV